MGMELIQSLPEILPHKLKTKALEAVRKERTQSQSSFDDDLSKRESTNDETKSIEDENKEESGLDPDIDSIWNDWSIEELKRLLDFQTTLFLSNFAVYVAHKVMTAHNMEVFVFIFQNMLLNTKFCLK